ncbi:UNVERIFIED_CONTAM: hypothetical protein Cloal_3510 [Acetivibrio alkalicellulosi]
MNYAWDMIIIARQLGIDLKKINFVVAKSYSPYMELSNTEINSQDIEGDVEVNPYYRFYEIFKNMFNVNDTENMEFKKYLFDVTMHFLTKIDTFEGMNKKEYYKRFILTDIDNEMFGGKLKEKLKLFSVNEQDVLAHNIIRLYITGEMLYLFKDTIRKIFKNSIVYVNYEAKDELLFYISHKKTTINEAKIELIKEVFLPIKFRTEIYWNQHFGIIDVEETMEIDNLALY